MSGTQQEVQVSGLLWESMLRFFKFLFLGESLYYTPSLSLLLSTLAYLFLWERRKIVVGLMNSRR